MNLKKSELSPWNIIQSLLLALIIDQLYTSGSDLFWGYDHIGSKMHLLLIGQFVVFLVIILRFYLGAFRFNYERDLELEGNSRSIGNALFNCIATFTVFSFLYFAAGDIKDLDRFFWMMVTMHLVDIIWFFSLIIFTMKDQKSKLLRPVFFFLIFSFITIVVALFLQYNLKEQEDVRNFIFILVLFFISILDFWTLRHFYLNKGRWELANLNMKMIVIESPYKGNINKNTEYAKLCVKDSIDRGEAPYASHLFYTHVLDDNKPRERDLGLNLGLKWGDWCDLVAVYTDYGISSGMQKGIDRAKLREVPIEYRTLDPAAVNTLEKKFNKKTKKTK